jgi:GAF domain
MRSRAIRVLLVLAAVAGCAATGYFVRSTDATLAAERSSVGTLQMQAQSLLSTLADVRAAQAGYVARGQGEDFWMGRVTTLLPVVDRQLSEFRAAVSSQAALTDLDAAAAAIDNFHKLDARAQEYVKGNDSTLASDLIFSDGLEAIATATGQVRAALADDLQSRETSAAALKIRELTVLAGGAGGVLLILMLLGFSGAAKAEQKPTAALPPVAEAVTESAAVIRVVGTEPGALTTVARVCMEMARVMETGQLPALLERSAGILDASGIIVWIADPAGRELRPAMAFGYSDQVMARMGGIPRDAANAAAAAYRAGEMRTAGGDGIGNGALVVPLLTADGCIGVLSAEMKDGAEKNEASQALASIFAAQLATLVSAPASAALTRAAEA